MAKEDRTTQLRKIKEEIINCQSFPLYQERTKNNFYPVIGEGSHWAKVIFVGEAPGLNEAKSGRPFCGAAGRVLDELLESADIKREEVYITNIVKDRPPQNRDPSPDEIAAYFPFLKRQIAIIRPRAICPLGRYAMKCLMEEFGLGEKMEGISKIHGRIFRAQTSYGKIIFIMPLYHPAVAVYNANMKDILKADIKALQGIVKDD